MWSKIKLVVASTLVCLIVFPATGAIAGQNHFNNDDNSYIERDRLETMKDTLKLKLEVATLEKQLNDIKDSSQTNKAPLHSRRRHIRHGPRVKVLTISGYKGKLSAEIKVGKRIRTVYRGDKVKGMGTIISIKENTLVFKNNNATRVLSF